MNMCFSDDSIRLAVEKYSDTILRVAINRVKNTVDAEDILQEVFLSLVRFKPQLESDEHLKAWLIKVAINKCNDFHRHKRSKRLLPLTAGNGVVSKDFTQEDGEVFDQIKKLKPLDRDIVVLHYIEGYTASEVGDFVGKTEEAVFKRLSRIRVRLKDLLDD